MKIKIILLILTLIFPNTVFAENLISVDGALKKVYRKATDFEKDFITLDETQITQIEEKADITFRGQHSPRLIGYKVLQDGQMIGYALEDIVMGKWGPIHYLTALDNNGIILQVVILDFDEIRGKPVAKRRFLKQYSKKSVSDPVKLRRDVDGVSGATISSRSLTDGVRKTLFIYQIIQGSL